MELTLLMVTADIHPNMAEHKGFEPSALARWHGFQDRFAPRALCSSFLFR